MPSCPDFSSLAYQRPDFDALQKLLPELTRRAKEAGSYEELRAVIQEKNKLWNERSFLCQLSFIRCFLDSSDPFYAQEMQYNDQQTALLDDTPFTQALLDSPFAAELDTEFGTLYLQGHRDHLRLTANGRERKAKEQELVNRYQQLAAAIRVSYENRELSEGEMTPYLESPQRDVRRAATRAVHQAYLGHREEFESILSELVDTRIALARANGFERYVDYINLEKGRRGYGQTELLAFCEQVKRDLVPLYAELNRRQAGRLGLTKLASCDVNLVFPDGNAKPIGDGPTLLEAAKEMYDQLGEEIGGLYREMADHGYIDVTASPHKITGMGFCDALHTLKIPYIFGNCNGSIHDTTVLTHEMGHAYQMWLCMNHQPVPDFVDMPNDVVEIPSMAMEQFTAPFAELFFDDGDKFRYHHTQHVVREICAFCATHEFEDWLYAHPGAAPAERARVFLKINRAYFPEIDDTELEDLTQQGSSLFRSMGIYMFPGYLISYALSDMGALEFRVRAEEDFPAAWADYRALCMAGGSLGYDALLRTAHLSTAYAPGTVARAAECLRKALK